MRPFRSCLLLAAMPAPMLLLAAAVPAAAEIVRIGGTGMTLAATRLLGDRLAVIDPLVQTEVLPSLGTPGGMRALVEGETDIAPTAHAVTPGALRFIGYMRSSAGATLLRSLGAEPPE